MFKIFFEFSFWVPLLPAGFRSPLDYASDRNIKIFGERFDERAVNWNGDNVWQSQWCSLSLVVFRNKHEPGDPYLWAMRSHFPRKLCWILIACSRLRDSGESVNWEKEREKKRRGWGETDSEIVGKAWIEKKSTKKSEGAGERQGGGACTHFLTACSCLFWYTSSWYTLWLVSFDSRHQHLVVRVICDNQKDGYREAGAWYRWVHVIYRSRGLSMQFCERKGD